MTSAVTKLGAAILAGVIPFASGCVKGKTDPNALEFHVSSGPTVSKLSDVIRFKEDPDNGKVFVELSENGEEVAEKLKSAGFKDNDIDRVNLWAEQFNEKATQLSQRRIPIEFRQLYTKWENYGAKLSDDPKNGDKMNSGFVRSLPHLKKAIHAAPFENPFARFDLVKGPQQIFIRSRSTHLRNPVSAPLSITLPDNVRYSHNFGTPATVYFVIDYPLTYDGDPVVRQGVRFDLVATIDNTEFASPHIEERELHMYAPSEYLPITIYTKDTRYIIGLETLDKGGEK